MTTVTTVGYGDITAHSTVEQVGFATSTCSYHMRSYSEAEHVSCAMMAVLWQHPQHMFFLLWGWEAQVCKHVCALITYRARFGVEKICFVTTLEVL